MSITIPWRNSNSLPCVLFTLGHLELSTLFREMVLSVFTNGVECANSLANDPHVDENGAHCASRRKRKQCVLDGKANYIYIWSHLSRMSTSLSFLDLIALMNFSLLLLQKKSKKRLSMSEICGRAKKCRGSIL